MASHKLITGACLTSHIDQVLTPETITSNYINSITDTHLAHQTTSKQETTTNRATAYEYRGYHEARTFQKNRVASDRDNGADGRTARGRSSIRVHFSRRSVPWGTPPHPGLAPRTRTFSFRTAIVLGVLGLDVAERGPRCGPEPQCCGFLLGRGRILDRGSIIKLWFSKEMPHANVWDSEVNLFLRFLL